MPEKYANETFRNASPSWANACVGDNGSPDIVDYAAGFASAASLAAFAVLRQRGRRYVCVMESNGNGSAAFVRLAFVGRIPPSKNATLTLFYKVADVKKIKAFNKGPEQRP